MSEDIIDQGFDNSNSKSESLPGAGGILTTGIISLVLFSGLIGFILAIVTLVRAQKARDEYRRNPSAYTDSSYRKVNSGRICSIISLALLGALLVVWVVLIGV